MSYGRPINLTPHQTLTYTVDHLIGSDQTCQIEFLGLPHMRCQATTKSGRQCKNGTKSGSDYCGIHSGGAKPRNHSRTKRQPRKKNLRCTYCDSTSVRALSVIYAGGIRQSQTRSFVTSRGTAGLLPGGKYLTPQAQSAAPPPEETEMSIGSMTLGPLILLFGLGGCTASVISGEPGLGLAAFLLCLVVFFIMAFKDADSPAVKRIKERNRDRFRDWEDTYRCSTCGYEFIWRK